MVTQAKVAICIPSGDEVKADFAYSLAHLVGYSCSVGISVGVKNVRSSCLSHGREKLAELALEDGATHAFWLDSDMVFPHWTLERLLSHDVDIVASGAAVRGALPARPVAAMEYDALRGTSIPVFGTRGNDLIEVAASGFGCVLMKTHVLRRVESPRFPIHWSAEAQNYIGEDYNFCDKARQAGYSIMLDPVVTRHMGHTGTFIYTLTAQPLPPEVARGVAWSDSPSIDPCIEGKELMIEAVEGR